MKDLRTTLLWIVASTLLMTACKHTKNEPDLLEPMVTTGMPFTQFKTGLSGETCLLGNDTVELYAKSQHDYSDTRITFSLKDPEAIVVCDGDTLTSKQSKLDLSYPRTLTVISADGQQTQCTVVATSGSRLPAIYIQVNHEPNDTETLLSMVTTLDGNGQIPSFARQTHRGVIRGRGNSSFWNMPKRPFKLKFDSKIGPFGLRSHRDWVLLANYADKTHMRVPLAFDMGKLMRLPYTPNYLYVELYINNEYRGVYLICDQVELGGNGRVDARYLIEINRRVQENGRQNDIDCFRGAKIPYWNNYMYYEIEGPSTPTWQEHDEIRDAMMTAENVLFSGNYKNATTGFRKYWDEETGIKWGIINELTKNADAKDYASIYLYQKTVGGKFYWGPLWDFDLSCGNYGWSNHGNCEQNETSGWYIFDNVYFARMRTDAAYTARMKEIWAQYKNDIWNIIQSIPERKVALAAVTQHNAQVWPTILDYGEFSNYNLPDTYDGQVTFLKNWLEKRYRWMDSQLR